jgi:methionyl-tRNA formyltransferase
LAANADGIVVACGKGVLRLSALQKAGSRRLNVREFLSGTHIVQGSRFALPS